MKVSAMADDSPSSSLFDQVGGDATIAKLVDSFYGYMDSLPTAVTIRAMHAGDLGPINEVLRQYLTEWLGGPKHYSASRGHPRLRLRHMPFKIAQAERDAWMECMTLAVEDTIADPAARVEILTALGKLADWMRNQHPTP